MSDSSEMNSSNSDDGMARNQTSSPSAGNVENTKIDIMKKLKNALIIEKKAAENPKAYHDNGRDYKYKIVKFLQNEKEALAKEAKFRGVQEKHIHEYLEQNKVPDLELGSFLGRLDQAGILTPENGYADIH